MSTSASALGSTLGNGSIPAPSPILGAGAGADARAGVILPRAVTVSPTEAPEPPPLIYPNTEGHNQPYYDIFFIAFFLAFTSSVRVIEPIWRDFVRDHKLPTILCLNHFAILQMFCVGVGILAVNYEVLQKFISFEVDPVLLFHFFIPILIFYSSFCVRQHVFGRKVSVVARITIPAFVLIFGISVAACFLLPEMKAIQNYKDFFILCGICACIMTTIAPDSTVATLRQIGDPRNIGCVLESESVVNNTLAILVFEVLLEVFSATLNVSITVDEYYIIWCVCRMLVFSILYGYVFATVTGFFIGNVISDVISEITILLASLLILNQIAVMTTCSGIVSVAAYGMFLKTREGTFEDEPFVRRVLDFSVFILRTMIYVLAVLVVTTFYRKLTTDDIIWSVYLYGIVLGARFVAYALVTVIFCYKQKTIKPTFKNIFMLSWGSLKGAYGLSIALYLNQIASSYLDEGEMFYSKPSDDHTTDQRIRQAFFKIMLYSVGQCFLTLVINANSVEMMARLMGMLKINMTQRNTMKQLIDQLRQYRKESMLSLQNNPFFADAHWDVVRRMTVIVNPYEKLDETICESDTSDTEDETESVVDKSVYISQKYRSLQDYQFDMGRLQIIKALKLYYSKRHDTGFLEDADSRILVQACEYVKDRRGAFVNPDVLRKNWNFRPIVKKLHSLKKPAMFIQRLINFEREFFYREICFNPVRRAFYKIVSGNCFPRCIDFLVMLNAVGLAVDIIYDPTNSFHVNIFKPCLDVTDVFFCCIYIGEAVIRFLALDPLQFFRYWENSMYVIIATAASFDVFVQFITQRKDEWTNGNSDELDEVRFLATILRNIRAIRIFFIFVVRVLQFGVDFIDRKIRKGYNVGKGFVYGEQEIPATVSASIRDHRVVKFIINRSRMNQMIVQRELSVVQNTHPKLVMAMKTKNAIRHILNEVVAMVQDLRNDGFLDHFEEEALSREVTAKLKAEANFARYLEPTTPKEFFNFITWVEGDDDLSEYLAKTCEMQTYEHSTLLIKMGDPQDGIYVIVNGLVYISFGLDPKFYMGSGSFEESYDSTKAQLAAVQGQALPPNFRLLGAGNVFGEVGVMTDAPRSCDVICATNVKCLYLSTKAMFEVMRLFPDVRYKMWKMLAVRVLEPAFNRIPNLKMNSDELEDYMKTGVIVILNSDKPNYSVTKDIDVLCIVHGQVNFGEEQIMGPDVRDKVTGMVKLDDLANEFAVIMLVPKRVMNTASQMYEDSYDPSQQDDDEDEEGEGEGEDEEE